MGTTRKQYFNLGLVLAVGLTISGRGAAADSKMGSQIAVHVYNYARVNQETLAEAEKVAAGIFGKAGVEIRWVEVQCSSGAKPATQNERTSVSRSYIQIDILTREMFDRLGLPDQVM